MKHIRKSANPGFLLGYLRVRDGLSQNQLAKECGLHTNDISRFERGRYGQTWKYRRLADFFHIKVDTLVRDDIAEIAAHTKNKLVSTHRTQEAFRKKRDIQAKVGCAGEDIVTEAERAILAGTKFANAVNPHYAESLDSGFDIMSFTSEGEPKYIEVKTTLKSSADTPFFMSAREIAFMNHCREKQLIYQLHRVYDLVDDNHWSREVYSLQDMENYEFIPTEYLVRRRNAK